MARRKSESKRNAILVAATEVFAERGLSAPTSAISAKAGVADGSLYTYFKTKDELVNVLYLELKAEMADAIFSDFPRRSDIRHKMQHVWDRFLLWGIKHARQHKTLQLIMPWAGLAQKTRQAAAAPFLELEMMVNDAITQSVFRSLPPEFFAATVVSLAEMTMGFMRQDAARADKFRALGFDMLWAAIKRER
jgi:AcrR family transcriptional regulator